MEEIFRQIMPPSSTRMLSSYLGLVAIPEAEEIDTFTFSLSLVLMLIIGFLFFLVLYQRRLMKKDLREKRRLKVMFDYATEGILMVNREGEILMVNPFAENLFGYSKAELVGQKIEKLIPERFEEVHKQHRGNFLHDPHSRPMGIGRDLYAINRKGEEFPVEVSLGFFRYSTDVKIIAFVTDITQRKKVEEELIKRKELTQQLNAKLEDRVKERTRDLQVALRNLEEKNRSLSELEKELQKALEKERDLGELKSRFVTMASHEFRTPLTTIMSSVFLLENYTGKQLEDAKCTHFKRIKRSVENMTHVLNDFLSLSKLEEGIMKPHYEDLDVPHCIKEILEEMELVKKPQQQLKFEHSGPDFFKMDKQIIKNIIINLLSNAIKFSGPKSTIEVVSHLAPGQLVLKVKDNGMGIPESEHKHLFNRFFRADNAMNIEGTGLGLHIIKKYIEILGGTITFTSQLEVGTEFTVTIPGEEELRI
jgi:PAS domain S-box-containing protein